MNGSIRMPLAVSLSCDINTGKNQSDCTNCLKCLRLSFKSSGVKSVLTWQNCISCSSQKGHEDLSKWKSNFLWLLYYNSNVTELLRYWNHAYFLRQLYVYIFRKTWKVYSLDDASNLCDKQNAQDTIYRAMVLLFGGIKTTG